MKQLYFLLTIFSLLLSGCLEDPDMNTGLQNALKPEFEKFSGDDITKTATTIVAKATIKKENGSPVTERGFQYWEENSTNIQKETDKEKEGKGTYSLTIDELIDGATYMICPYAINGVGTSYGDTIKVNTNRGTGRVKTTTIEDEAINATSVNVKGIIAEKGEGEYEDYGFRLFNAEKDTTFNKEKGVELRDDSVLVYTIEGLEPNTEYFVEAYAKNKFGTFSSDGKVKFTTKDGLPQLGSISLKEDAGYDYAILRAELVCEGDSAVKEFGFCWGTDNRTPGRPNIEQDDTVRALSLDADNFFEATIKNLSAATNYYVIAYATNAFGTRYSNDTIRVVTKRDLPTIFLNESSTYVISAGVVTIGGELQSEGKTPVSELAVYYSSSTKTPGPENYEGKKEFKTTDLDENNKFTVTLENIKGGKEYYVRAYATNESGSAPSNEIQKFTTPSIFGEDLATFPGSGRVEFSTFCVNSQIYILGGYSGTGYIKELYGYSPSVNKWAALSSYNENVYGASVCTQDDHVYSVGGRTNSKWFTELYTYENNSWSSFASMDSKMECIFPTSFVYKDSIILIGGERAVTVPESKSSMEVQDTIYRYDMVNKEWIGCGNFPVPIKSGVSITSGDSVFVGLGSISKDNSYERGLWLNTSGNWEDWAELADAPTGMGNVSSGILFKDCLYYIDNAGIIWRFSLATKEWSKMSSFPRKLDNPPVDYRIFLLDDTIYIFLINYYYSYLKIYDPLWDVPQEQK